MGVTRKREIMPGRQARVDDDLWNAAMAKARTEGVALSELVRNWLADYIDDEAPALTDLNRIVTRLSDIHKRLRAETNGHLPELEKTS